MTIHEFYFDTFNEIQQKYGNKVILLLQVGGFFEVYSKQGINSGIIYESNIEDICKICDLNITKKTKGSSKHICHDGSVEKCKIIMCGIPLRSVEKYIDKLQNNNYTCVIYEQDKDNDNIITRKKTSIITPGTYIKEDVNETIQVYSNNIMTVKLYYSKSKFISSEQINYGIANIDVRSGDTFIFEHQDKYYDNLSIFDELEKHYTVYNPKELFIIYDGSSITSNYIDNIIKYIGCNCKLIRIVDTNNNDCPFSKEANLFSSQKYCLEAIKQYYRDNNSETELDALTEDIMIYSTAYESLCFLLDFIHTNNPSMTEKMTRPNIKNPNGKLTLANHSLKQLNIINDNNEYKHKLSCIISLLNNCLTSMGKRKFIYDIVNPITCTETLSYKYDILEYIIKNKETWELIMCDFKNICDFDTIYRSIVMNKSKPNNIYNLYISVKTLIKSYDIINEKQHDYFNFEPFNYENTDIYSSMKYIISFIEKHINIERVPLLDNINSFEDNFLNLLTYSDIKDIEEELNLSQYKLECIAKYYSDIIKHHEGKHNVNNTDNYIKIIQTDKNGIQLKLTATRGKILTRVIKNKENNFKWRIPYEYESPIYNSIKKGIIEDKNISVINPSKDGHINSYNINYLAERIITLKEEIKNNIKEKYDKFIDKLKNCNDYFKAIGDYVSILDTQYNNANNAIKYKYCKPNIIDKYNDEAYFESKQMRHPLIEKINEKEIYVPNDVIMNPNTQGILLFGTNAVGKSSLIKSIGINIIMAQAGMFVACNHFNFNPFKSIYTRILGNDDIYKGLSTFAVEMSELRTILNNANKYSIVLGDELCSGTELGSAMSIFAAGVMNLHELKSKYIFATHFHDITNMNELNELTDMKYKHMSVMYDEEIKGLRYDRIIRDGPGNNRYGLEVGKSMSLPNSLLDTANKLRNKYFNTETSVSQMTPSRYNANKLKGDCEKCGNKGIDVHHMEYQENADENGFIRHFKKNNNANLINVCKECHDNIHRNGIILKKVKTTEGYKIIEIKK